MEFCRGNTCREKGQEKKTHHTSMNIEELLIIFTALIFTIVGYFLGKDQGKKEEIKSVFKKQVVEPNKAKSLGGVIDYPSQAEIDYHGSEQEKADIAREELFKKTFGIKP